VLILENLDDMSPIAGRVVTLYAFPMKLRGSEVTSARVVAKLRVRRCVQTKIEFMPPEFPASTQPLRFQTHPPVLGLLDLRGPSSVPKFLGVS
jgi:hypothetical protein